VNSRVGMLMKRIKRESLDELREPKLGGEGIF
jgi:hypothetical protein